MKVKEGNKEAEHISCIKNSWVKMFVHIRNEKQIIRYLNDK